MASSVSVAALSIGWRTTSVCSDAHARPIAEIESRSPTRTVGVEPGGPGVVEPAVGGDERGVARDRGDGAPVERRGSGDHDDRRRCSCAIPPPALPGSGSRVGGGSHPLSPPVPRAPRVGRSTTVAAAAEPALADDRERGQADDDEDHARAPGPGGSPRRGGRSPSTTASAGWATWMMPIVPTSTSRWANAISPWPSMPVSTDEQARRRSSPCADSGHSSSPARMQRDRGRREHADRHHRRHEVDDVDGRPGPPAGQQVADPRADDDDDERVAADASPRPGLPPRNSTMARPTSVSSAPRQRPRGRAARGRSSAPSGHEHAAG